MQTRKSSTSSWSSISSIFRFNRGDGSSRSNSHNDDDANHPHHRQHHPHSHINDRKHSQRSSVSSVSSEASSSSSQEVYYGTLAFREHSNKDRVIHNSRIKYKDGSYRDGILMAGKRSSSLPNPHHQHHHQHQYQDDNIIMGVGVCGGGSGMTEPNTTKPTEIELENYRLAKQKLGSLLRELQKPADKVHYRVRCAFDDLRDLYEDEFKRTCQLTLVKSFGHASNNTTNNNNDDDGGDIRKSQESTSAESEYDVDGAAAIARAKIMHLQNQGMHTSLFVVANNNNDGVCGDGDGDDKGVKNRSFFCGCIKIPP